MKKLAGSTHLLGCRASYAFVGNYRGVRRGGVKAKSPFDLSVF